ncbi:MAG: alpha-L-fucosidase [Chloroflexia bacterium]
MQQPTMRTTHYEPTWDSLQEYAVPEWFKDAKFGIFIHWGVYAVPAFESEWYPRNMYRTDSPVFNHHRETWGPQSDFGYKDFVPMFRAERWNPDEWVALFKEAGARYVVPVGEHHDGFAMYDSAQTRWNSAAMGPRRDVAAEMERVVRGAGMKFGLSSHRAFNWRYYTYADDFDTVEPQYADLYSPRHPEEELTSQEFIVNWRARTAELIDRYHPDLMWFDFGWHADEFASHRPEVAVYYYNQGIDRGQEVVLNYKDGFPRGAAVLDIERGKLDDIREPYWQTDTSVSYRSWSYIEDDEFKSVTTLVHDLVDIVSKNGNLLLNVGPRADGTIPDEVQELLRGVGAWLSVNGEAIYGSRPWERFGEGPTGTAVGHLTERQNAPLTPQDIRFTTAGDALYAICPGPASGEVLITSSGSGSSVSEGGIAHISLLGSSDELVWSQDDAGLHIQWQGEPPSEHAVVYKITLSS